MSAPDMFDRLAAEIARDFAGLDLSRQDNEAILARYLRHSTEFQRELAAILRREPATMVVG